MTSNNNVTLWYCLINENKKPILDCFLHVDLPNDATIGHLRAEIGKDLLQTWSNIMQTVTVFEVWRCTDQTAELPEGDMQVMEQKVKDWFEEEKVRKLVSKIKIQDLHLQDNESLFVKVVVTRSVWYLTVDHEMRPTSKEVVQVVATRISELVNCEYVKKHRHHGKVVVWRSTVKKLSIRVPFKDLTEMIDQINFGDPEQATRLRGIALVTDVDRDELLIVQLLDGEGENRFLPLLSDENLNEDYAKTYSRINSIKSSSTYSKSAEYSQNQTNDRDIIYDGLYAPYEYAPSTSAAPIHIYHPIFWQFTRRANDPSVVPDSGFLTLVRRFMAKTCKVGLDEYTMQSHLKDILQPHISAESNDDETGSNNVIMFKHFEVRIPMAIAEYKRTLFEDGCDPSIQAGISMRHKLGQSESKLIVDKCCCPVFMLAGGGPWLCVLGGVFTNRFIVQRLTDMMWIGFGSTHEDHRVYQVAKVLFALKESLRGLEDFYEFVVNTDQIPDFYAGARDPHSRHFPYPHSFDDKGTAVVFEYLGRLEADMTCVTFLAKIKATGENIVVKFVDRYGAEAHQLLGEQGHAPRLLYYGPLPETTIYDSSGPAPGPQEPMNAGYQRLGSAVAPEMKMVVMEYIPRSKPRLDSPDLSHNKISAALKELHMNGYVFGDLRGPNIMFDTNEEVKFIDFDWAGRYDIRNLPLDQQERVKKTWARLSDAGKSTAEEQAGFASYPIGISLTIPWADGTGSCLPILPEHDTEMLNKLRESWLN